MKLTKQLESEVNHVYFGYWDSYFKGQLKKFISFLDDEYKLIGTSEIEVVDGKSEAKRWLKNSINEIKGKAEFRNRKISFSPVNDLVLVTELSDVYLRSNAEWEFYSKIRISTLLRQTGQGWKVFELEL